MKKILTSSITDSAQLPILKRTIDHLQEQELENIKSCVFAQLGSSTETLPIVLWGCVGTLSTVTVSNDTLTITAGAMMYLNEIYQVDAQAITKTGANVFALNLDTTTFQAGEPTLYSDGVTSVNTNQIAKIKLVQVLTGAGICDWDNRLFANSEGYSDSISSDIFSSISLPAGFSLSAIRVTYIKKGVYINIQGFIQLTRSSGTLTDFNVSLKNKAYILNGDTTIEIYAPCMLQEGNGRVSNQGNIAFKDTLYFTPLTAISSGTTINVFFTLGYQTENLL